MSSLFFAPKDDPSILANGPYQPYGLGHILFIILSFLIVYLLIKYVSKKDIKERYKWVYWAYAIFILINLVKWYWNIKMGFDIKTDLPLQLCSLQIFLIPLALFARGKPGEYMGEFCFAYGGLGFLIAMLAPLTTQFEYPFFHFISMQNLIYHVFLGFIAFILPYLHYQPVIKNIWKAYIVIIIITIITGIINVLISSNYLYTAYLPLPEQIIPWPYYIPLLLAFALLAARIPYYIHKILDISFSKQQALYSED